VRGISGKQCPIWTFEYKSLKIFQLKDKPLEASDNLPDPDQ
jgi:hypothetical protein